MVERERQEKLGKRKDRREAEQDKKSARERVIKQVESVFDSVSKRVPSDDIVSKGEGAKSGAEKERAQNLAAGNLHGATVLAREAVTFQDEFSRQNFGADNVTVTTVYGFQNSSSESDDSDRDDDNHDNDDIDDDDDDDDDAFAAAVESNETSAENYRERYLARKKARKQLNLKLEQERLLKSQKARVARKKIVIQKSKKTGARSGANTKRQRAKGRKTKKGRRR